MPEAGRFTGQIVDASTAARSVLAARPLARPRIVELRLSRLLGTQLYFGAPNSARMVISRGKHFHVTRFETQIKLYISNHQAAANSQLLILIKSQIPTCRTTCLLRQWSILLPFYVSAVPGGAANAHTGHAFGRFGTRTDRVVIFVVVVVKVGKTEYVFLIFCQIWPLKININNSNVSEGYLIFPTKIPIRNCLETGCVYYVSLVYHR